MRKPTQHLTSILMVSALAGPAAAQEFAIPEPIAKGHEELYSRMQAATEAEGAPGEAATRAMEVLGPHFRKEEDYALPQLGLLPQLAGQPFAPDAADLSAGQRAELAERTERFRAELPRMLEEHAEISAALDDMIAAAEDAGDAELAALGREIKVHAATEEKVLYPTVLLIGRYVGWQGGETE